MVDLMQERPAYVQFEWRAEEDRQATLEEGHFVAKDVEFAIVQPVGGNLIVEKRADEWFKSLEERDDPFIDRYRRVYEAWKQGQEEPVDGTPLKNWAALSPAQLKNFQAIGLRSIEDVAAANEATLMRMGMGSRSWQQKAQAYLESSKDMGKISEQMAAMQVQLEGLVEASQEKDRIIEDLKARLGLNAANEQAKQKNRDKTRPETSIN